MKKSLLILSAILISLSSIAQSNYYETQWQKVAELTKNQKSQDAEKIIRQVMATAKKEKNTEQTIKSLILLRNSIAQRDEKDKVNTIQDFEKEIRGLRFPEKNIMHSMIASLYHSYYQNNRYKIYKRTEVADSRDLKFPADIETWTPQLFFNKIQEQYDASLENTKGLKEYKTTQFPELIQKGKNTATLRPTLFDVLVHRAIDYYQNNEIDITKASYYFKLKSPKAFAPADEFASHVFKTKDDYSTKYVALSYLQLATRFHLNDTKEDALIDLEAKRLLFVKNNFDGSKGRDKYIAALQELYNKYPNRLATAKPILQLANELQSTNKASAVEHAEDIVEQYKESIEFTAAKRLIQNVKKKELRLTTEKADVAGKNILGKLNFRNIDNVYFKIIPLSPEQFKKRETDSRANKTIPRGKSVKEWNLALNKSAWKNLKKYDAHETEIKIDKLSQGHYAIIASGDPTFSQSKSPVSFSLFQTNDLSYVVNGVDNGNVLYVVNRSTGQPINGARVTRYISEYDYNKRRNVSTKVDSKLSDAEGRINYVTSKNYNYRRYDIEIEHQGQQLYIRGAFNSNRSYTPKDKNTLHLFTDRAIYRPGQTIYFKGIFVQSAGNRQKHQVLSGKKIDIILKDANYKEVKKQTLTTNNFGSINGTFTAPEGLLNGRFTLYTRKGQKQIRVEEYKRPKFEVTMDKLNQNVKLGDQITVSGNAKAYAGNSIEGAKVKYIVKRNVRWPYYWCYYRWGGFNRNSNEIVMTQGETTTDADGKFSVTFLAEGDENIDQRTKPFYDFAVHADVTDVNGEVRSGDKSYAISKESLLLSIGAPSQSDFNKFNSIKVQTTNIQGKFTATDVKIEFIKLTAPERFLKKRMWQVPKQNLLSQSDFAKYFPDYEYKNESKPLFWAEGKTVWQKNIRTKENERTFLQKIAPNEGYYLIKATARDKDNNLIEEKKVVRMVNTSRTKAVSNEALFTNLSDASVQPGDQTNLSIASAFRNAYINKSISRQGNISHAWDQKTEQFAISEKDRGGFSANYFTVRNNRLYSKNVVVSVPWSNKNLKLTYETFRDKILPGSQQEWKIKISGNEKEKVSAELLATMYDASLDAFAKNYWSSLKLFGSNYTTVNWNTRAFGTGLSKTLYKGPRSIRGDKYRQYPQLNMYGLTNNGYGNVNYFGRIGGNREIRSAAGSYSLDAAEAAPSAPRRMRKSKSMPAVSNSAGANRNEGEADDFRVFRGNKYEKSEDKQSNSIGEEQQLNDVKVRTNMSETAFFFPDLKTDQNGDIILSFTAPEALTRWNVKTFAHTTDMQTGSLEKTLVTQKQLMLTPNHPRFMRESDKMIYSTKVSNLSNKNLNGTARLQIINAKTNENIDGFFSNAYNELSFDIEAGKNKEITWNLAIPETFTDPVIVRIVAQADGFSDGEQKSIPLLLNSMLVTETIPLPVRANTTRNFKLDKLINSGKSSTLKHHKLTVEYTANPAWYAVQALPYLTDYPYECSEQTFNRYYANALASHIANSSPRINKIFSEWKEKDTAALLSNLEKNQELKSALLQETPWVFEAENETAQKKLIANLFNVNRMSKELALTLKKLEKLQTSNGGFAWFKGMRDNRFITQYIITGIARLQKLGLADAKNNEKIQNILNRAIPYLDSRIREDYLYLVKKGLLKNQNIGYTQIQYLYMRSFFQNRKISTVNKVAFNYYKKQGKKHWNKQNKYMQGMLALAMNRYDEKPTAENIMEALRQNAIHKEEMGMYWKEFSQGSYWWHSAPIEAHSLLIEAFREIPNLSAQKALPKDQIDEVDELRIWLLKQKQTTQWKTTKATADACYALLLGGADWLGAEPDVRMKLGSKKINLSDYKQEAGTGYTKFSFNKKEVKPEMGNIEVSVKSDKKVGTTWGAVYWQYFEQLDKITESETPLSLKKQVYKVVQGDRGDELVLVKDGQQLTVGDKVKIRIELRVDRRMEFVHMKDMRGACFEPTNVLSNYKYQNGLGYYESTKDASTQFFFDNLRPGTYVFEYPMFTTLRGDYSNGITTIQCMYAPEFSSHSEGIRVQVK